MRSPGTSKIRLTNLQHANNNEPHGIIAHETAVASCSYLYTKNEMLRSQYVNIAYNSVNVWPNLPIKIQFLCMVINHIQTGQL